MNNLNADRYFADGHFPSSVFAGLKQSTKRDGGCTILFDRTDNTDWGFIVAKGEHGFLMTRKQFYSGESLETVLQGWIDEWIGDNFDGFGTWFDSERDRICIDPITICIGIKTALMLAKARGEKCIYDTQNKTVITC